MPERQRSIRDEATAVGATTLISYVYESLRRDIISGRYAPSEKLRIEHIRAGYGVAASTMREALARLISDGLVTAEGQRGFRVAPMSPEDLHDITRLRIILETEAVLESMRRGDLSWEARLVAAFHTLTRADAMIASGRVEDFVAWEAHNKEFHRAMAAACESPRLLGMVEMLFRQHERYRMQSLASNNAGARSAARGRDVHAEHEALLKAALDRDFAGMQRLLAEHIQNTANSVLARLAAA